MIKVVGRYQQFRAVKLTVQRLLEGKNPYQRSGIIWHTQGSGKSLTMMFMIREMYLNSELRDWKVLLVTDRTQLEKQLLETSENVGFGVNLAKSSRALKALLKNKNSDINMAMIHKFKNQELQEVYEELNPSPKILVMTDEAHRSQYSKLAANLNKAIPNATHIAYTGTPTDKTEKRYKEYIDRYTMRQAIEDEVTLSIVYTGRTQNAEVEEAAAMDQKFLDVFSDYNLRERLQILGFASKRSYLEAQEIINQKAEDMFRHWVNEVFPNEFKAQVVATSRIAASRYKKALEKAQQKVLQELERENPLYLDLTRLKNVQVGVVISGQHNEEKILSDYTDPAEHERIRKSFLLPFGTEDQGIEGNMGIVVVQNMWLTGFDAPVEQVLYMDRTMTDHSLLQAIARVNRLSDGKGEGFVVDYVGVGHHLKEALDNYDEREQKEILENLQTDVDDLNELKEANREIQSFFALHQIEDLNDHDAIFDLFYDEEMCMEYMELFRRFTKSFSQVLPRKEALDFMNDLDYYQDIQVHASSHFQDERVSMVGIPKKLRPIIDEHLKARGIAEAVAPISIFDQSFEDQVGKRKRKKTRAAAVEHAIRNHIEQSYEEDPELYASFAEILRGILHEFRNNWEKIQEELEKLREQMRRARQEPTYGLHRVKEMPFFRAFKNWIFENREPNEDEIAQLVNLTQQIFQQLRRELSLKNFWENAPAKNRLNAELLKLLISKEFYLITSECEDHKGLVSKLIEIAEINHDRILYGR